jgi:hypothetical protein
MKEGRYRINQFLSIVSNLDKVIWESDTVGYLRF